MNEYFCPNCGSEDQEKDILKTVELIKTSMPSKPIQFRDYRHQTKISNENSSTEV